MSTYSFQEVEATFSHPSLGVISTNGLGMGSVSVNMATDRATATTAADGTVVINKIKDRHGNVSIDIQQTSDVHKDFKRWWNYLESADASEFAKIKVVVTSKSTKEQDICTGVAMVKQPDNTKEAEVGNANWNFLAADIQQNIV